MIRLTSELKGLFDNGHILEKEIRDYLGELGYEI